MLQKEVIPLQNYTSYHPWNPGFETYGSAFQNHSVPNKNRLSGLVCDFYEIIATHKKQPYLSAIPDGCHDIIIVCNKKQPSAYFSVSIDTPRQFDFPEDAILFGIRFLPSAAISLPKESLSLETPFLLQDIFSNSSIFIEKIAMASTMAEREGITCQFLQNYLSLQSEKQYLLHYCIQQILSAKGHCTISWLAQNTGYSTRYLHRLFQEFLAVSPKSFAKIIRMQSALSLLHKQKQLSFTEIAMKSGYADQSHMYRDILQLTQHTPKEIQKTDTILFSQNHIKITTFKKGGHKQ